MTELRLEPQPWMTDRATRRVLRALTDGGARVRFVGGCVRDSVLEREITDIDLATDAPPERVMDLLLEAGIKAIPTGVEHGTVTAVASRRPFEITTLRRDVESHGRHATVAFTDDWEADAARRDFTMNALSLEPGGVLHDPFGGIADAKAGRVRFVGDPRRRIEEDVLRLLRFFRFYAHYGAPPPDPDSLAACREMADRLPTLSAERIRNELLRLLVAPDPAPVVRLMHEQGVLGHFLPEAAAIDRLDAMVAIEAGLGRKDPLRRLAALAPLDAEGARRLAADLRFSNTQRDRWVAMATPASGLSTDLDGAGRRRLMYRIKAESWPDMVLSAWCAAGAPPGDADWRALLRDGEEWRRPRLPLNGQDVTRLGVAEGAAVGDLLRAIEQWWIDGDFQAGREECLARLSELAS